MIALADEFQFVSSSKQYISCTSETEKVCNLSYSSDTVDSLQWLSIWSNKKWTTVLYMN